MKISMERSGGFAGTLLTAQLDTSQLDSNRAAEVTQALQAARFFELPESLRSQMMDDYAYIVEVDDGATRHRVLIDRSVAGPELRKLLDLLQQYLKPQVK